MLEYNTYNYSYFNPEIVKSFPKIDFASLSISVGSNSNPSAIFHKLESLISLTRPFSISRQESL